MTWPSLVCLGFQKCGTTTLYEILRQHPGVALCRDVKEPMYLRVLGLTHIGGGAYYEKRYFGHLADDDPRMPVEVNAGLTFTGCAEKVARYYPADTKLLFMMRNPVDRSFSAYRYFLARGFLPTSAVELDQREGHAAGFDAYVHSVLDDDELRGDVMRKRLKYLVFSQSRYATCIREYLRSFPVSQMHFAIFEEFVADQHAGMRRIYDFCGLDDADGIDYGVRGNCRREATSSAARSKRMQFMKGWCYGFHEFVAMGYWLPSFEHWFQGKYREYRSGTLVADHDDSKMLPETRAFLEEHYAEEVRDLEAILARDLSDVWF